MSIAPKQDHYKSRRVAKSSVEMPLYNVVIFWYTSIHQARRDGGEQRNISDVGFRFILVYDWVQIWQGFFTNSNDLKEALSAWADVFIS